MEARPPLEFISSKSSSTDVPLDYDSYTMPSLYHKDVEYVILNSKSVLIRVERAEAWAELRFESKSQSNQSFNNWLSSVFSNLDISKKMSKVGVKKALNMLELSRFKEATSI